MDKDIHDAWSLDGQVFYHDDEAYGVSEGGTTIYLGDRESVLEEHPTFIKKERKKRRKKV